MPKWKTREKQRLLQSKEGSWNTTNTLRTPKAPNTHTIGKHHAGVLILKKCFLSSKNAPVTEVLHSPHRCETTLQRIKTCFNPLGVFRFSGRPTRSSSPVSGHISCTMSGKLLEMSGFIICLEEIVMTSLASTSPPLPTK